MHEVSEARVKYEARNKTRISKNFDILLHFMLQNWPCFTLDSHFTLASHFTHEARGKHTKKKNQNGNIARRTTF